MIPIPTERPTIAPFLRWDLGSPAEEARVAVGETTRIWLEEDGMRSEVVLTDSVRVECR